MNVEHLPERLRAAEALRHLVGIEGQPCSFPGISTACRMPEAYLIVAAGDTELPLDPFDLLPLALREDHDVMAIWVDRMLAGHVFLIDAVLVRDGQAEQFAAYRLWRQPGGPGSLVPSRGDGPTIAITKDGLLLAATRPWCDKIGRLTGLSQGQAWLHKMVWKGTPFASAIDRNLHR